MIKELFVTGTDTGCGKTFVCCEILSHLASQGFDVVGLKPIASGAEMINGRLQNSDVKLLYENTNIDIREQDICRYIFAEPCSPHIASMLNNQEIELDEICKFVDNFKTKSDIVLVEGIGGWHVPLNDKKMVCDLAAKLNIPVILVISNKLGCLNHASLTRDAILKTRVQFLGWVLNRLASDVVAPNAVESSLEKIMGTAPILTIGLNNQDTDPKQFEVLKNLMRSKSLD